MVVLCVYLCVVGVGGGPVLQVLGGMCHVPIFGGSDRWVLMRLDTLSPVIIYIIPITRLLVFNGVKSVGYIFR